MMSKEKRKRAREEKKEEPDTMDIYEDKQLEEMLEDDEITEAEYSFMLGRDKKKKKLGLKRKEHEDTQSVELAKQEYEED
jgi:hypothetical protein